ncbi:MAG: rhodanese-like domain-containing protein [Nocardioidaceae bacterium]
MQSPIPEVEVSQVPVDVPSDLAIVDVRENHEWAAGHIDGALHIPMAQVPGRVDELPAGARLIVVCRVGARSGRVTGFLLQQGRDAVNLAGGMLAWQRAGRAMSSESGTAPDVI